MAGAVFLRRYQALELLGEGGMGRVYLGQQLDNGRSVVIKVMHDHIAGNTLFRQAFQREMRLMMRFRHPYAVELYDASGDENSNPCIIMEYVAGFTLAALVEKHHRLPAPRIGQLLGHLCQVMQAAHDNGIIHRDLTPVNVMVLAPDSPQEKVKVMDFGLARMGAGPYIPLEKLTGDSQSIGGGTPDYVSPEQVRGEEVDHRADIYSLGVLLFKVLTGYLPFEQATTTPEILRCHREVTPPRFAALGAHHVPAAIEEVVQSCLAKYPRERPQSALELAERYEKALGRKILPAKPIAARILPGQSAVERIDPRTVMDHLQAWMPEPIAIVKLRGFVHDIGGDIIESEPGLIRFRLRDPASPAETARGLFAMLGLKKSAVATEYVLLELRLEKAQSNANQLNITVMMRPERQPARLNNPEWRQWCQLVCRELRGYLISR